ncbi:pyridoxamine 5'-phosphate oxidase family protein [Stratiformator vulcanicus]|uniref:Pyridoxamine 5'-phosphate oxidase n=1 Tax=Stratiformator vulcanicus TaxID=2527980 RepID=A0A517R4V9_9PLAN|nr:pyridoxamine 5'-phosphate oxidase family protein [Stratiformator vulcanicus]QDT38926.1 Pyridoxamine 5'-phosphate oxidase [Stratiformator vulcanicus]
MSTATADRKHFQEILGHFDAGMLVTRSKTDELRVRPMLVAELQSDADLLFLTRAHSALVEEISEHAEIVITFQSDSQYLSLSGTAKLERDAGKIQDLWSEEWNRWFPEGSGDETLAIVHVQATQGEYWDAGLAHGLNYLFEAGKAIVSGKDKPDDEAAEHGKVDLGSE